MLNSQHVSDFDFSRRTDLAHIRRSLLRSSKITSPKSSALAAGLFLPIPIIVRAVARTECDATLWEISKLHGFKNY